ncbi:hypothetical protein BN59_03132 [Legionella massiliensis]|uniref:Fe-S protein n=1 Tax=Legionella massiliensis TaxID=1034943 RepID=A0A078L4G2_9GAMM|nr:transporter [Legionella massiliensis]CDZ78818.1 hypothetical protein BN59_03132 [Legionella massiliensis]CEE14556.1 hypothetical protein BN1094_03132 [Legionella massiliensis]
MQKRLLSLLFLANTAFASPWFTGPLLAPAGKTIPAGHFNFEPYGFYTEYPAGFRNVEVTPILTAGINSFMDLQTSLPYDYSWDRGKHGNGIGDYSIALGFQALRQKEGSWLPDLRIVLQEVIPTGRFERLDPKKLGTDQTGSGSYQTFLGFNFQKLFTVNKEHYIRTRLSLVGSYPSDVKVHGVNAFGGNRLTEGKVHPGRSYSVDAAIEYTLTQHWVPVMEALYVHSTSTNFSGNPGFTPGGSFANVGGKGGDSASLAPAVEYNFTPSLGIIGGVWFSVTGPHGAKFASTTVAVNYFF